MTQNANKTAIFYKDQGNSNYGTAIIGTVSGTSISYGSPVVFYAATANYIDAVFDSSQIKLLLYIMLMEIQVPWSSYCWHCLRNNQ